MNNLQKFIERLKQGDVEFYTRFQEEEWGCRYLGNGRFERWRRNYMENRNEIEELDEAGVHNLFANYSGDPLLKGLLKK
ncbi:MAG: hypothetical protein JXR90_15430 [Spirochaetes bacterium]|nr:hypothetical protein [Bacteroidales bacterium]MBN2772082.1 hypothetical protein [Spirochaetota bacterium]